jgi:HD-GYP domain-containing protein (c-di-GMP phosphodiesterase class II)
MYRRITEQELELKISNLRKELLTLKQSENASKIELAELNQIFQTVADGVVVIDKDFNVIRVNDTFTVLSGFNERECIGRKCYDIFPGALCHTPGCPMVRISCYAERVEYEVDKQRRVAKLSRAIATDMGFSWDRIEGIRMAAAIHDFSKIHVPAAILARPGRLSEADLAIIKRLGNSTIT